MEQATVRSRLLLSQGLVRARLQLTDEDTIPPPFDQLEVRERLGLWEEVAELAFAALADPDKNLRAAVAADLRRKLPPEAHLFGEVMVPLD